MLLSRTFSFSRIAAPLLCAAMLAAAGSAEAARAELMSAALTVDEPGERPGLFIEAHYEFDLPMPLVDAMHRGIALYFTYQFELSKDRWYWFDKNIAESDFNIRLAFNPLTRRYAVSYIKNIRRWRVASPRDTADSGLTACIRFYLDAGKLPKPMQVTNHDSGDWTVESDWTPIALPKDLAHEED